MSLFTEYENYDAVGLGELIRQKQVTPDELLDTALDLVATHNPAVNAVVHLMEYQARTAIHDGLPTGPLSGVPFMLKDLYVLYEGEPTTNGSHLFHNFIANHDSTVTERFRAAGLVIMAKTNTPEFGLNVATEPVATGPTLNPWNPTRTAGGSSGGASAAVATGMVPIAHATDGGGSIRIPASNCGLFGLKPTRARVPAGPDAGEGWSGLSTGHVVSRTVRDSAAVLDATHGPAPGDPYSAPLPLRPFRDEVGHPPGQLRVALWTEGLAQQPIDSECVRGAEKVAAILTDLGHEVSPATPPISGLDFRPAMRVIMSSHTANHLDTFAETTGTSVKVDDTENIPRLFAEEGRRLSGRDYVKALSVIHRTGRQLADFFKDYDVILSPTLADRPLPLGIFDMMGTDLDLYFERMLNHLAFTPLYNITGCPAASLPLHMTPDGLPVGIQLGAQFGDEATLFQVAAQLEQAHPWWDQRPPLST